MTGAECLFEGLPDQVAPAAPAAPAAPGRGLPRLRQPERCQPGWQIMAIDDLVARDHRVRAVWVFVGTLDGRGWHDAVKAREEVLGQRRHGSCVDGPRLARRNRSGCAKSLAVMCPAFEVRCHDRWPR